MPQGPHHRHRRTPIGAVAALVISVAIAGCANGTAAPGGGPSTTGGGRTTTSPGGTTSGGASTTTTNGHTTTTSGGTTTTGGGTTTTTSPGDPFTVHPTNYLSLLPANSAAMRQLLTMDCRAANGQCYVPAQLETAYDAAYLYRLGIDGTGVTIGIVDSFGSPTIRSDLAAFDTEFSLPAPPSFTIVQPAGPVPPYQPTSLRSGWALETTLDVELAHLMAPGADITLAETPDAETEGTVGFPTIVASERYLIDKMGVDVISQSFAATEQTFPSEQSVLGLRSALLDAYSHHVSVLGATGDWGASSYKSDSTTYYPYPVVNWPASDPLVTAVGGTHIDVGGSGERLAPDSVWNDSGSPSSPSAGGGGTSIFFGRPSWQDGVEGVVGAHRGIPDISMTASGSGPALVYYSAPGRAGQLVPVWGTSVASPLFAGVVALADQLAGHALGLLNPELYKLAAENAPGIVDVTSGNNSVYVTSGGRPVFVRGWSAVAGYDLASGLGTVDARHLVPELAGRTLPSA